MRLDEEGFTSKLPWCRQILLCVLAPPLEVLKVRAEAIGEVGVDARIRNKRVDVRAEDGWDSKCHSVDS
jgi:hypothetical protein